MGSLDIDPVYSTSRPSITSTRSTSKFHLIMFQYSPGVAVMLDAITYSQDCTDGKGCISDGALEDAAHVCEETENDISVTRNI